MDYSRNLPTISKQYQNQRHNPKFNFAAPVTNYNDGNPKKLPSRIAKQFLNSPKSNPTYAASHQPNLLNPSVNDPENQWSQWIKQQNYNQETKITTSDAQPSRDD